MVNRYRFYLTATIYVATELVVEGVDYIEARNRVISQASAMDWEVGSDGPCDIEAWGEEITGEDA
jgi:hypothetical protein